MLWAEVAGLSQPRAQLPRACQRMLPGHLGAGACPDLVKYLQTETIQCSHTARQPLSVLRLQTLHIAWSGLGTVCMQRYQAQSSLSPRTGGVGAYPARVRPEVRVKVHADLDELGHLRGALLRHPQRPEHAAHRNLPRADLPEQHPQAAAHHA